MSFGHLAGRFAKELAKGDFIPSKPGALGVGYDLWARHENGDVILHCTAGWFDLFRPVQPGDAPDFELAIEGRSYRLVRGVDAIPSGFVMVEHPGEGGLPPRSFGRPSRQPFEEQGASE